MSKSTSKKEANLKASAEELIESLLKRISGGKCGPKNQESIKRLSRLVKGTKGLLEKRQKSKRELITSFGEMEREIDLWEEWEEREEINKREERWGELMDNLEELLVKRGVNLDLLAMVCPIHNDSHQGLERDDSPQMDTEFEVGESSNNNYLEKNWSYDMLDNYISMNSENIIVIFLVIFPKNSILKKRQLINWLMSLGFYLNFIYADELFHRLIDEHILEPVHVKKHNQVTHLCKINRTFHMHFNGLSRLKVNLYKIGYSKISCAKYTGTSGWPHTIVLNQDQQYLCSSDLKKILKSENNDFVDLAVVQLGKWGGTDLKSKDHIEVDDTDFLNHLSKYTNYLGLQGISRIDKLPESIGNLPYLWVLDLRACHNLEKLPEKPQSKRGQVEWFFRLMYLDISECYLLDHMPKWISELYCLEVLKGFVAGNVSKKESCQLRDLVNLQGLRKLSIRIAKQLDPVDASALEYMKLSILTVTWGIKHDNDQTERKMVWRIYFPETLEKLDLRGYPESEVTELNPTVLPNLKRLYIRGGKLSKIETGSSWEVLEVLRLRFLNNLELNWSELQAKFTRLKHVEYEQCLLLKNFPENTTSWNTKKDDLN